MLKMRNADGAAIFFLSYRVHMKIMEAMWPLTVLCVIPPALAACGPAALTAGPHRLLEKLEQAPANVGDVWSGSRLSMCREVV